MRKNRYIRQFQEIGIDDVALVGGKNASLGELFRHLRPLGVRLPNGFAITAQAFRDRLAEAAVLEALQDPLRASGKCAGKSLSTRAAQARKLIYQAGLSEPLQNEILAAYHDLCGGEADFSVAVRSSATAEDLPSASFAGQHDSFLNVRGEVALLDACQHCFASLFTDRAITYRENQGIDHAKVALSVGV